jgi:hypothetical protein
MKRPTHLRLLATKMTRDVFDLVVAPGVMQLYSPRDRKLFERVKVEKPAPPPAAASQSPLRNLNGRAMRLALASFELPGRTEPPNLPPGYEESAFDEWVELENAERGEDTVTITSELSSGEVVERVFDSKTLFLKDVEVRRDGLVLWRVHYDDYAKVQGAWVAHHMVLNDKEHQRRFTLNLHDVLLNEGIQPGAFVIEAQPGVEVVREEVAP